MIQKLNWSSTAVYESLRNLGRGWSVRKIGCPLEAELGRVSAKGGLCRGAMLRSRVAVGSCKDLATEECEVCQ